jgi:DNA-binding CsgD family transcriptional regulator
MRSWIPCWREEVGQRWESLTEREREVVMQIATGKSNRQIAETLSVAKKTVEYHGNSKQIDRENCSRCARASLAKFKANEVGVDVGDKLLSVQPRLSWTPQNCFVCPSCDEHLAQTGCGVPIGGRSVGARSYPR